MSLTVCFCVRSPPWGSRSVVYSLFLHYYKPFTFVLYNKIHFINFIPYLISISTILSKKKFVYTVLRYDIQLQEWLKQSREYRYYASNSNRNAARPVNRMRLNIMTCSVLRNHLQELYFEPECARWEETGDAERREEENYDAHGDQRYIAPARNVSYSSRTHALGNKSVNM